MTLYVYNLVNPDPIAPVIPLVDEYQPGGERFDLLDTEVIRPYRDRAIYFTDDPAELGFDSDDGTILSALSLAADEADSAPLGGALAWHRAMLASLREQGFDVISTSEIAS